MQTSHYQPLSEPVQEALRQGQPLIVEANNLRRATWIERSIRWLNGGQALRQDRETAEWLIKHLDQAQGQIAYAETLEAVGRYIKACHQTCDCFKRLENTVFAHKCHRQLPSLAIHDLIEKNGLPKHELLHFLKNHSLHYVIPKAHFEHKETALLLADREVYIRAKEGISFLDTPAHIDLILQRLPSHHPDTVLLQELRQLREEQAFSDRDMRIKKICEQLTLSHYTYQPLKELRRNEKGLLISQSYLAEGIEDFKHSSWSELKPNFLEKAQHDSYKLRIVTRLPAYALEKSWFGTIKLIMRNLFNFRAHGHSWIEITQPIYDEKGRFEGYQYVYNVGYYFHPLDRFKRLESADPMAYMPIPSKEILVEEIEITSQQYCSAQLYLKEVQRLIDNPRKRLNDRPRNACLSQKEIDDIQYIYQSTIKSTCLSFANTLKEVVTGIKSDYRGRLQRWLNPKKDFKRWDRIDHWIDKTYILSWIIRIPRFLMRMELPFWVKHQASQRKRERKINTLTYLNRMDNTTPTCRG